MNPDRIYSQYRDDALADQVAAGEYGIFVAMPFHEHFSYRSMDILENVIKPSAVKANDIRGNRTRKAFGVPFRADDAPNVARPITEDVIRSIIETHIFLADLTFMNAGVLVELGVALGMKPNNQIVLIMQGKPEELHFDIKDVNVYRYNNARVDEAIGTVAEALIAAGHHYDEVEDRFIRRVGERMSPDEFMFLAFYADIQKDHANKPDVPSLNYNAVKFCQDHDQTGNFKDFGQRFLWTIPELLRKKLMWNQMLPDTDQYGLHATKLGWRVIKHYFPTRFQGVPERVLQE
ncbi:MAG: hypothetical protein V1792_09775 [Pseudomonadota bacterium]